MDLHGISPAQLLSQSTPEVCSNCDGRFFAQTFMFRRVSKILVGSPQDQLVPIPVFRCDDCGTPIGDMMPDEDQLVNDTKLIDLGEN
jgi:hypothetical protein